MSGPMPGHVDVHAHAFVPSRDVPRVEDGLAPAERDEPIERLWETLRPAGVAQAVLVPLDDEDAHVAAALAGDPRRLRAVAAATAREQGRAGVAPVAALRARRAGFGFSGLRTRWLGDPGRPIRESPMWPVLTELAAEGIVLWSYLPPEQQPLLADLSRELPELRILLNHLGFAPHDMQVDEHQRPWFVDPLPADRCDAVIELADAPNVHVMLSGLYALTREGPPYRELWPWVRRLRAAFGIERMMWGSDMPWPREAPGYVALREASLEALGPLTEPERDAVLASNARTLFDFDETGDMDA